MQSPQCDNLVNVVVGAVVDASVYAFPALTMIVLFRKFGRDFQRKFISLGFFNMNK